MVLCSHVKQCKKYNFYLGKGGGEGVHNVFGDRPTKWPIANKKNQNICSLGCTTTNLINQYEKQ